MTGYANVVGRFFANLFGGSNQSQKPQKNNNNDGTQGGSAGSNRKRSSAAGNRSGSGFATASQGDTSYYPDDGYTSGGCSKPQKKKQSSVSKSQVSPAPVAASKIPLPIQKASPVQPEKFVPAEIAPIEEQSRRIYLKNKLENRDSVELNVFEDFELRFVKFLGSGGQGEVHQVVDQKSKSNYALKIIKQNSAAKKYEKEALEAIKDHNYPGIIHLEASVEDEDFLYLLTQYVEGLTVRDIIPYMDQFNWDRKREFVTPLLAELCLAIDYLHQLGYVHRDIKASNCFLDTYGHVTIGDFGSCIQKSLIKARVIFGTVPYTISPEMFCKVPYGTEADYWGIGVLACELLLGFFPFDWFTRDEIKSKNTVNDVIQTIKRPQIPDDVPEDVQRVLHAFLAADPKQRLGSADIGGIASIENHPFFAGIHWERFRNAAYRKHSLPVLKLMKAIQRKKAAKAAQQAASAAAAAQNATGVPVTGNFNEISKQPKQQGEDDAYRNYIGVNNSHPKAPADTTGSYVAKQYHASGGDIC